MNIITFSDKKTPFPPVPMSKVSPELIKKMLMDIKKNKPKSEKVTK